MDDILKPIGKWLDKRMALHTALTLLEWDEQTLAPERAIEATANAIGILNDEMYKCMVNDDIKDFLERYEKFDEEKFSYKVRGIVKRVKKDYEENVVIPPNEYSEYSVLIAKANRAWENAKNSNDFEAFAPVLTEIIEYVRRFAGYRKKGDETLYDVLLGDYEEGFNVEKLDEFFELIKNEIVPLIKQQKNKNCGIDKSYNKLIYPKEKQEEFCEYIARYMGFDFKRGVMAQSAHPFTTNLHNKDVRITNHYYENDLENAIFSCIHETGHALYELDIPDDLTQTLVGEGTSMGMHESQSRFYENIIGRSKSFWIPLYEKLKDTFPENLENVDIDTFIAGINNAEPGLIRTQADELTYPVHIMIRYEIEKMAINQGTEVHKLKELWDDKYEEYLGVRPENDAESILQDVHWAGGSFGYFPSYAIGNAFGAQIYHTMKDAFNVDGALEAGNIHLITEYLSDNIHRYGACLNSIQLIEKATGEGFNPTYYIDYLKEKFS